MNFQLARRLKQLRMKSRAKDYKNISELLGLSSGYLKNIEDDINKCPGLDVIEKISEYYGLSLSQFFTMDEKLNLKVCVDVDGVILDWNGSLERYLKTMKGINFDKNKMTSYSYTGDIGCSKKDIYKAMEEEEFLAFLYATPYKHAYVALDILKQKVNVQAYTASSDKEFYFKRRVQFCEDLGLGGEVYPSHNHTGVKPVLPNIHALFEDNLSVIKRWLEEEPDTIIYMIDQPYNRPSDIVQVHDNPNLKRCASFIEAVELFLHDFGLK